MGRSKSRNSHKSLQKRNVSAKEAYDGVILFKHCVQESSVVLAPTVIARTMGQNQATANLKVPARRGHVKNSPGHRKEAASTGSTIKVLWDTMTSYRKLGLMQILLSKTSLLWPNLPLDRKAITYSVQKQESNPKNKGKNLDVGHLIPAASADANCRKPFGQVPLPPWRGNVLNTLPVIWAADLLGGKIARGRPRGALPAKKRIQSQAATLLFVKEYSLDSRRLRVNARSCWRPSSFLALAALRARFRRLVQHLWRG